MTITAELLKALPKPTLIEELDEQVILGEKIALLVQLMPEVADLVQLESEPLRRSLEENAYRELLLRQRINEAFEQTLVVKARESNLDALAGFYDCLRLAGEGDEAFRERIILEISGRSTGGTAERYEAIARAASVHVKQAIVWCEATSPLIHVAVLSTAPGGVASPELLKVVEVALNDPAKRMVNDHLQVQAAVSKVIDVEVEVWLLPQAPHSALDGLAQALRLAWEKEAGLGFSLTPAWIAARVMQPGLKKVNLLSPSREVIASPYEALALGSITVVDRGRAS